MFRLILQSLAACILCATSVHAAVWESHGQWTPQTEEAYSQWVSRNWTTDYFVPGKIPNSPFSGLTFDCADVVYSMRLVFAYEHNLPFVIKDPTGGKLPISNEMRRWDHLPGAQRARRFLQYIQAITGTVTLPNDTYPTPLTRDFVKSGSVLLTDKASHHSWTIKNVNSFGIPHLIYSSRPAKNVISQKFGYPTPNFVFPNGVNAPAGFRAFRTPEFIGKDVTRIPTFSEEQYSISRGHFFEMAESKLALATEAPDVRMHRLLKEACDYAQDRVNAVNEALTALAQLPSNACFDAQKYDDFSTPNRDTRLRGDFEDVVTTFDQYMERKVALPDDVVSAVTSLKQKATEPDKKDLAWCPVHIGDDRILTGGEILNYLRQGRISNNPHDPLEIRWGLEKGPSARAKACRVY